MARCVEGHETTSQDFCDICGMPVVQQTPDTPDTPDTETTDEVALCPNCGAPRPGGALFCESCGYDYTTGALPAQDLRTELGLPPAKNTPHVKPSDAAPAAARTAHGGHGAGARIPEKDEVVAPDTGAGAAPSDSSGSAAPAPASMPVPSPSEKSAGDTAEPEAAGVSSQPGTAPDSNASATPTPAPDDTGTDKPEPIPSAPTESPTSATTKHIPWVAEVWVDPQWYAFQESSDPLPPQGPPRIVALKDSALIGRHSASRNIHPDIDCEPDVGCSRRQAYLTSADGYWYINDLDSANGTFIADATASLPDVPIAARTRISPDTRIYVGAWTRIVVRPAIESDLANR